MNSSFEPKDAAVRREALMIENSYIVQAPAGSGKTELLTQRFLKLLARVESPEEIVAITFTRKAAAEMRDRVLKAIEAAQSPVAIDDRPHKRETRELGKAVLERSNAQGWDLLNNPGRLRIQTVDSFCASVVQQMPLEAGFGAATEVVDDDNRRKQLYERAALNSIQQLLESSGDELAAITRVLKHLDNNIAGAKDLIARMLERRDQWERHISGHNAALLRSEFQDVLKRIVESGLRRIADSVPKEHEGELIELLRCAERNLVAENRENKIRPVSGLTNLPGCTGEDVEKWRAIAWFLLTGDGNWRSRMSITYGFPQYAKAEKRRCEELLVRLREQEVYHPEFRCALQALGDLPGTAFADWQWQVLEALLRVLPFAVGELQRIFRENAATDFIEVAEGTARALDESTVPSAIRHLLVDEFQDTSVMQWRLFEELIRDWRPGDGRTLFLVGDPMQSIYRFRQAEVGLFIQAKQNGLAKLKPRSLALTVNFRSSTSLVEWFNERFAGVFGTRDDAAAGVVSYKPCDAADDDAAQPPSVIKPEWVSHADEEAERVAEIVQYTPGEIAILVRARTHLPKIVSALRGEGIAFEAVDIQKLGEVPVVQDLLMLTRALLHPADRIAWIAVLRAPWSGLTLTDLHALCGYDLNAAVWDCVNGDLAGLSEDGRKRVERIRGVLADALTARRRLPLREWVQGAWLSLGGPACLASRTELDNAEAYFELLEGFAAENPNADDLAAGIEALFAKSKTDEGVRVKVMTIHKAKGLEFETVILPGLGRGGQRDDAKLLLWEERAAEEGTELLLAPISQKGAGEKDPIYRYLQKAEAERASEEQKRLLYVAVTRARKNLYLIAEPKLNQDGNLRQNGSLLRLLWPGLRQDFRAHEAAISSEEQLALAASAGEERKPRLLQRLPADWQLPPRPEPPEWSGGNAATEPHDAQRITYDWVGEKLRNVGIVVHSMIQRIARDGLNCWPAARISQGRCVFTAALRERGLLAADLEEAVNEVEKALLTMANDERGRWILAQHPDARNEFSLSGVFDCDRIEHVVLDRTFLDENGLRWIIDYKTARHEGAGREAFLDNEQLRHKEQLERYAQLMRVLEPDRPIRFGLYFPLLRGWREWQYELQTS
jgi:ATP-dependent helicase/nuclease subunit A